MPITVNDLIGIAGPAVMAAMRKPYILSPVYQIPDMPAFGAVLHDPVTFRTVRIVWTPNDNIWNNTEAKRIDFVKALLENAVNSLDFYVNGGPGDPIDHPEVIIPYQEPVDEGEDVVNDLEV